MSAIAHELRDVEVEPVREETRTKVDLITRIEETTQIDTANKVLGPVAEGLDRGKLGTALSGEWLGHPLHPLLTDLPIGFWTSSWVLDLVGGRAARGASTTLIGFGILSAVPTAASGAVEWNRIPTARPGRVGVVHAVVNSAALVLYVCSWRARHRGHHVRGVALGMGGALAATAGGYLGGHLAWVYGIGRGRRGPARASM